MFYLIFIYINAYLSIYFKYSISRKLSLLVSLNEMPDIDIPKLWKHIFSLVSLDAVLSSGLPISLPH